MIKKTFAMILCIVMILSIAACQNGVHEPVTPSEQPVENPNEPDEPAPEIDDPTVEPSEPDVSEDLTEPTEIDSTVGAKITNYDTLATILDKLDSGENLLFSPLSFNLALGLISEGASDELKSDFEKYFNVSFDEYIAFYRNYIKSLDSTVEIANAAWLREDFLYTPEFREEAQSNFNAELGQAPFNQALVERINNWCAEKTHDMIPTILDSLDADATSVILNALYFKGMWKTEYEKAQPIDFLGDTVYHAEGLYCRENVYLENDKATGFMKFYEGDRYAFVGILPKTPEWTFASLDIQSLMDSRKETAVDTMIPKFEFDCTYENLEDVLGDIGLGAAMSGNAFTKLAQDADFCIDQIIQKTKIKLDEKGTEAAAVTAIITKNAAVMEDIPHVYLDKPFAFMIFDTQTNTILFIGKVVNPVG